MLLFQESKAPRLLTHNRHAWRIGGTMARGALHEVGCHGKPGLVCPDTPGAHSDMDILTYLKAIPVLVQPFVSSAAMGGILWNRPQALFKKLREQGRNWEATLMAATKGVNTHRGLLFVGSLVCAAAGAEAMVSPVLEADPICRRVADMTKGLCKAELGRTTLKFRTRPLTAGERLYREHGLTGIRGEAEAGLPSVVDHGLPALRQGLDRGAPLEHCLLQALLALMAHTQDTTVVNRAGVEGLRWLRETALEILSLGGALTPRGREKLLTCREDCLTRRISPGGAADLLAVTIALHLLRHDDWPAQFFRASQP